MDITKVLGRTSACLAAAPRIRVSTCKLCIIESRRKEGEIGGIHHAITHGTVEVGTPDDLIGADRDGVGPDNNGTLFTLPPHADPTERHLFHG